MRVSLALLAAGAVSLLVGLALLSVPLALIVGGGGAVGYALVRET